MISDLSNQAHGSVCGARRIGVTVIFVIKHGTCVCDVDALDEQS